MMPLGVNSTGLLIGFCTFCTTDFCTLEKPQVVSRGGCSCLPVTVLFKLGPVLPLQRNSVTTIDTLPESAWLDVAAHLPRTPPPRYGCCFPIVPLAPSPTVCASCTEPGTPHRSPSKNPDPPPKKKPTPGQLARMQKAALNQKIFKTFKKPRKPKGLKAAITREPPSTGSTRVVKKSQICVSGHMVNYLTP
jgi:hypothetical protein